MPTLPQQNYNGDKQPIKDRFQTPPYALSLIIPHLQNNDLRRIHEPAAGDGYIVKTLESKDFHVTKSDILTGIDFLKPSDLPFALEFDAIVTNPPFSKKQQFLNRCYQLRRPFALLMPSTMIATGQAIKLFTQYGIEIIQPSRRICYKTPYKGWAWIEENPKSDRYGQIVETASQFPSAWYTYRLNIGTPLTFCDLHIPRKYHATLEYNELHARRATLTPAEQTKYNALEVYIRHLYTCHTQAGK